MLSPDVRFEGFTSRDWRRVLELFRPLRRDAGRAADRPQGLVIAVHSHGRLRKLVHSQVGRLRLDDVAADWPLGAAELACRHDAAWAVCLESGSLEAVMEQLGAQARPEDDFVSQCLQLWSLCRQQILAGRIDLWPRRLQGVPVASTRMIEATVDMVCPAGKAMLLGLFDRGELWTSVAVRRGARGIDAIVGPEALRPSLGLLSGDLRRDHRHVVRAAVDLLGPLSFGCFAEQQTFRKLEVDPIPGAWALAVAVRDVVLHPVPAAVALPLGIDAGRAALEALRAVAARLDPAGVLSPTLAAIRDVALGDRDIVAVLGFHPLDILRKLLEREPWD